MGVCECVTYFLGLVTLAVLIALSVYLILDWIIRIPILRSRDKKYILITGCDSGFGRATTEHLDSLGCHVLAACLTDKGEDDLKKVCSTKVVTFNLNVADPASVRRAFNFVKTVLPPGRGLWGLINNAGIPTGSLGPFEWQTIQNYRDCYDVNLLGLVDVTTVFLPLIKKERGRIVNASSLVGRSALSYAHAPYLCSKYAVEGFSDTIRRSLYWFGVSVHVIEPSFFPTSLGPQSARLAQVSGAWEQASDDLRREYGQAYFEAFKESMFQLVSRLMAPSVDGVVQAYTHALLAWFPRARYPVGKGIRSVFAVEMLPEWLSDAIVRKYAKFPIPQAALKK